MPVRKPSPASAITPPMRADRQRAGLRAGEQAERDAGEVQEAGADHEAGGIGERAGGAGHLGAVGVAVEDREEADDDGGDDERRAQRQHHRARR